jgi:hypothetical protein
MKKCWLLFIVLVFIAGPSLAAQDPAMSVAESVIMTFTEGCEKELNTYCKDVTPGEGRLIACIYAHEDKLSGQCEYALYDSAVQLERAVSALSYVINECSADIDTNCAGVEAGEGRIMECLEKNEDKVSGRCKGALKAVGLK